MLKCFTIHEFLNYIKHSRKIKIIKSKCDILICIPTIEFNESVWDTGEDCVLFSICRLTGKSPKVFRTDVSDAERSVIWHRGAFPLCLCKSNVKRKHFIFQVRSSKLFTALSFVDGENTASWLWMRKMHRLLFSTQDVKVLYPAISALPKDHVKYCCKLAPSGGLRVTEPPTTAYISSSVPERVRWMQCVG